MDVKIGGTRDWDGMKGDEMGWDDMGWDGTVVKTQSRHIENTNHNYTILNRNYTTVTQQ